MPSIDWDDDEAVIRWAENASRDEIEAEVDESDAMRTDVFLVPEITSAGRAVVVNIVAGGPAVAGG